jgi:hypothetical protein
MPKKYELPAFLTDIVEPAQYQRWLYRKAQAHVKRDRKRGNKSATGETYRIAIHDAVSRCEGHDCYTGEQLNWKLLSTYDNEKSKADRRTYKRSLALLPTVDHVGDGIGRADFGVCGWRTNGAKHDLDIPDFLSLCKTVLEHHGFTVTRTGRSKMRITRPAP